jgi:hypothetical protein
MAVDEQRRIRLYEAARTVLGEQEAATLMEYLPPTGWADTATKDDLDRLGAELRSELSQLRGELRGELRSELSGLRVEMHDALREQTTRLGTWMIPTWLSAVGLALTVSRLA